MNRINVISAGPGNPLYLTAQAREAMAACDLLYCADRLRPLVDQPEKCRRLVPFEPAMEEIAATDETVGILVSGDAGLYSLLPTLRKRFGPEALHVLPGISSVQLFCARLGLCWHDVQILSVHGRELRPSVLSHTVRHNPRTLFLLDQWHGPRWVVDILREGGLTDLRLTVGENLSGPDEAIGPLAERDYPPLCLLLAENPNPLPLPVIGLPDSAFLRNCTPMTKQAVRIQVLSALRLQPDSIVYDIGAGTGSISIECARLCPYGQVYAFEQSPEALDILRQNIRHFHLQNITVIPGTAPETLPEASEPPDSVFLGGTGGKSGPILEALHTLRRTVRLCATAVTLESSHQFLELFAPLADFTAFQLSAANLEAAGSLHLYRAQNPVTLFSATLNQ